MADICFIHGWNGSGTEGWFSELSQYLLRQGKSVVSLDFPNTKNPIYDEWKLFFSKQILPYVNKNTDFLCHSVGCSFIQRYITEEDFVVNNLIFIAPTVHTHGFLEIKNFFDTPINFQKVAKNTKRIFILGGGKDYILKKEFEYLQDQLSAKLLFFPEAGHFSHSKKLHPEILNFMSEYVLLKV